MYDDNISNYYSYDDNVPNNRRVKVGDLVIIREDDYLAGWSIIDSLEVLANQPKAMTRCPTCLTSSPSERRREPTYRCTNRSCHAEFTRGEALHHFEPVTQFRANYSLNWHEAVRRISYRTIESALVSPRGQNSIRPLQADAVKGILDQLSGRDVDLQIDIPVDVLQFIAGGHSEAIIRRRRGQRAFRFAMLERYGERCAFTGVQPPQVLEAAHLYSYAATGEHHRDGGLILRRDCHTLFDAKLLTVNPSSLKIEIAPTLAQFETYRSLDQRSLQIQEGLEPSLQYLGEHFDQATALFQHLASATG